MCRHGAELVTKVELLGCRRGPYIPWVLMSLRPRKAYVIRSRSGFMPPTSQHCLNCSASKREAPRVGMTNTIEENPRWGQR